MGFARFLVRRLLLLIPVVIGVTFITFFISRVAVPNPARAWAGLKASQETVEALARRYHLNEPFYLQYFYYLVDFFRGDWGLSPITGQPVFVEIMRYFPASLELALVSIFLAVVIGIPLGAIAAAKQDKAVDHVVRLLSLGTYSTPPFLLALVFQLIFFYYLGLLPSGGRLSPLIDNPPRMTGLILLDSLITGRFDVFVSALRHIILPALTLALMVFGMITRLVRSSMLESLRMDYIRTARSKGLSERTVIFKHALRNSLTSVVTMTALIFAWMLSGAVVVEYIFNWPGIGRYAVHAALSLDLPSTMGIAVLYALTVTIVNLIADLFYAVLDPRVKLE